MEDSKIIELLLSRNEDGIKRIDDTYGRRLRLSIGASRRKAHGKVGLALAGIALDNCQLSKWDIGKP